MSHHDKFWEKFGNKARGHLPEAYSPGDWAAMEQLLDGSPPTAPRKNSIAARLAALLLLLIAMAYLFFGQFSGNTATLNSTQTEVPPANPPANSTHLEEKQPPTAGNLNMDNEDVQTLNSGKSAWDGVGEGRPNESQASAPPASRSRTFVEKITAASLSGSAEEAAGAQAPQSERYGNPVVATENLPPGPFESREKELAVLERDISDLFSQGAAVYLPTRLSAVSQTIPSKVVLPAPSVIPARQWYAGFLLGVATSVTDYQDFRFSVMPLPGLFGGVRLNDKWSIQAELHAKYVNNYNLAYSVESFQYDSSNNLNVSQQEYSMKAYGALELPLVVKRRISPRLALLGGIRPSLIFEDKDGLSLNGNDRAEFGAGLNANVSERDADFSGQNIRHSDFGVVLGMEWAFHPRWSLDLRYNQGTRDLSPDNLYNSPAIHLNSDLQLTLRKRLW